MNKVLSETLIKRYKHLKVKIENRSLASTVAALDKEVWAFQALEIRS